MPLPIVLHNVLLYDFETSTCSLGAFLPDFAASRSACITSLSHETIIVSPSLSTYESFNDSGSSFNAKATDSMRLKMRGSQCTRWIVPDGLNALNKGSVTRRRLVDLVDAEEFCASPACFLESVVVIDPSLPESLVSISTGGLLERPLGEQGSVSGVEGRALFLPTCAFDGVDGTLSDTGLSVATETTGTNADLIVIAILDVSDTGDPSVVGCVDGVSGAPCSSSGQSPSMAGADATPTVDSSFSLCMLQLNLLAVEKADILQEDFNFSREQLVRCCRNEEDPTK